MIDYSVEKERDQFNRTMDDTSSFGSNSGQRLGGAGRRSFLKIKVKASFITNVDKLMNLTVDYFSFTILSVLRIYI